MSDHTDRTHSRQFIPLGFVGTGKAAVLKTYIAGRLQAARAVQSDNKSGDITQEQGTWLEEVKAIERERIFIDPVAIAETSRNRRDQVFGVYAEPGGGRERFDLADATDTEGDES